MYENCRQPIAVMAVSLYWGSSVQCTRAIQLTYMHNGAYISHTCSSYIDTNTLSVGRWGFVHIAQCRGFVTNGSNHWILRQPNQVSKTETMARGTEVLAMVSVLLTWSGWRNIQ